MMTYLFCSPDSTGYRKTKNDARIEGGLFLFGERVVARVHEKFVPGFWSFHEKFVSFEIFTTSFHRLQYLVQLIEHPILRIPNILFVYFLSIFSR